MSIFTPHLEVLPAPQRTIYPELAWVKEAGFVLYGGTAVALYAGHRPLLAAEYEREFERLWRESQ